MGKIPFSGDIGELAVQIPGEPVERTTELVDRSALGAELGPAMEAGVHIGPDFVGSRTHHDQGIVHDLIEDVIADIGDFLQPAGQLPGAPPDRLHFPIMPSLGEIALDRDIFITEVRRG